jgi:hypothetical protein
MGSAFKFCVAVLGRPIAGRRCLRCVSALHSRSIIIAALVRVPASIKARSLPIENLEERQLLSITPAFIDKVVSNLKCNVATCCGS